MGTLNGLSRAQESIRTLGGRVTRKSRLSSCTASSNVGTPRYMLVMAVILLTVCSLAQTNGPSSSSGLPQDTPPEYTSLKRFPQNLGGNFLAMFSKKNIVPLLIGSASTGVISIWDDDIQEHFSVQDGSSTVGEVGSALGGLYVVGPVVGGLLIAGHRSKNDRFHSFTYSLAQGTVLDQGLNQGMKFAIGRTRPDGSDNQSFPSGHASTSFMIATVVQRYYGWKAGILGYGVASFISVARMRDNKHWASDVTAGATLGYIVGSSVSRRTGISLRGTKFSITPTVDVANHRFGVLLTPN
ncbi:MAG TPA: phosphatase PAP2 family protein [Terriglobales bacterium]